MNFITLQLIEPVQDSEQFITKTVYVNPTAIESVVEIDDEKTLICTMTRQMLVSSSYLEVTGQVAGAIND
jgi:hypothetical protein